MNKLVYFSFSIMDRNNYPDWIDKISPKLLEKEIHFYNPWNNICEQLDKSEKLRNYLNEVDLSNIYEKRDILKLDNMLFDKLNEKVVSRLLFADSGGPNLEIPFKDLYMLLRSNLVIVDICNPSFGGTPQEVLYAYLLNIPVIAITSRFINSPWIMNKVKAICTPKNSDELMKLINCYLGE